MSKVLIVNREDLEKNFIVKVNCLLEAKYKLPMIEFKIVLILASLARPDMQAFEEIVVKVSDMMYWLDIKGKNYNHLKQTTRSLNGRVIEMIHHGDKKLIQAPWMSYAIYEDGGIMRLKLNDILKPFILEITGGYTKYKLGNVFCMKSIYSIRIYELLIQYIGIGKRVMLVADLRDRFCINHDELTSWSNFRKTVIDPAVREINTTSNIEFEWLPIKTGKKIVSLEFKMKLNAKKVKEIAEKTNKSEAEVADDIMNDRNPLEKMAEEIGDPLGDVIMENLRGHKTDRVIDGVCFNQKDDLKSLKNSIKSVFTFSEKDITRMLKEFGKEKLWEKFHYYHYCTAKQEIKSPTAWFISAVTKDYNVAEMKAEQKANEPDPLGDHLKELTAKQHELKIEINNAKQDLDSEVAKYSESIRAGFEADLAKYEEELKTTTEEIQILKSAYATQ